MAVRLTEALDPDKIEKIARLLRTTDITMDDIARRFSVPSTKISEINREKGIRPSGRKWHLTD